MNEKSLYRFAKNFEKSSQEIKLHLNYIVYYQLQLIITSMLYDLCLEDDQTEDPTGLTDNLYLTAPLNHNLVKG